LLPCFDGTPRDLPSPAGHDAVGVLVSEFCWAADAVEPGRAAVDECWPLADAVRAAAGPPRRDVLRSWVKLGYPRRALRLHAAATAIA